MEVKVASKEMALLSNILAAYTFIAGGSRSVRSQTALKHFD